MKAKVKEAINKAKTKEAQGRAKSSLPKSFPTESKGDEATKTAIRAYDGDIARAKSTRQQLLRVVKGLPKGS